MNSEHIAAHAPSSRHESELRSSRVCGCFHCLRSFAPSAITEWIEEAPADERTALCPFCGIDAVIGSQSGFPITTEFLKQMEAHWFDLEA